MASNPAPQRVTPASGNEDPLAVAARHYQAGNIQQAETLVRRLLALNENSQAALFFLGFIELNKGLKAKAEALFRRCVKLPPPHYGALTNLGNLLLERNRAIKALEYYRAALKLAPRDPRAHANLGRCLGILGRFTDAISAYRLALELQPDALKVARDLGHLLLLTGQVSAAETLWRDMLTRHPQSPLPKVHLGKVYRQQNRLDEAQTQFAAALKLDPHNLDSLLGMAWVLIRKKELAQARDLLRQILTSPEGGGRDALILGTEISIQTGNFRAAIGFLRQLLTAGDRNPQHYTNLAFCHNACDERTESVAVLRQGLEQFQGREPSLLVTLFYYALSLGDWTDYPQLQARVLAALRDRDYPNPIEPFASLLIPGLTGLDLRRIASHHATKYASRAPSHPLTTTGPSCRATEKGLLRIGYLSADFREHATAFLTASVFEQHDRHRFEVFAYSHGNDDGSSTRRRLEKAFTQFRDIRNLGDEAAAELIRTDAIDILVDLKGYTRYARTPILAEHPAPIQVNWLGYPGTMGAAFMDYIIVDSTVVPPVEAPAYQEALAYLPHAYAPLDLDREIAPLPARADVGLPEEGFIFGCFNHPRKIVPDLFSIWCRLLAAIPGSILWLYSDHDLIVENYRREASRRGIEGHRLNFASTVNQAEHLARLSLVDLVLDTLPYNAHTTSSDALFMGVPVLTCLGDTFAGRVAASLLRAAGIPEMVTSTLEAYEAKALYLASHPLELGIIRQRLKEARNTQPYFDTAGFTRHLEDLYQHMWERHQLGLVPSLLGAPAETSR